MKSLPRVGITVGDPAGIGPEIALKAAAHPEVRRVCEPVLYGPSSEDELQRFEIGRVTAAAGRAAYDAIVRAASDAASRKIEWRSQRLRCTSETGGPCSTAAP